MKIDFLIIGAQKGGSTWLYNNIQGHPNVHTPKEEIHYFSNELNYNKGNAWYHEHFLNLSGEVLYGEKTPEYFTVVPTENKKTSTLTHQRIYEYNPDMKLMVVLREPLGRLRSAINHMYRTRRIPPWVSPYDLILGKHRSSAEAFSLLENGQYYDNLIRFYQIFPKTQIKILFFETDVIKTPLQTLASVCSFLNIPYEDGYFPEAMGKKNEYQMSLPAITLNYFFPRLRFINNRLNHIFSPYKSKIDSETEDYLKQFYKPLNEKLRSLVGDLPPNWMY